MSKTPTVADLIDAVNDARGCGCCATYDTAEHLAPDACPVDEDDYKDHTYGAGCNADFRSLLDTLVEAVRAEGSS